MMDRDNKKRKLSQEFNKEASTFKYKKMHRQSEVSSAESTQQSTLTEKIVSLWKSGSGSGPGCIAQQENKDIMRLQDFEMKYKEADKIIQSIKKKFILSEESVAKLNILLKQETTEKQSLLNKISTTWELIANISQHINCVTENLDRFQVQTTNLSDKYDNVILKLRSEKIVLQTEIKELLNMRQAAVEEIQQKLNNKEIELSDLKVRYEMLKDQVSREELENRKIIEELENGREKLMEMETAERKMKITIMELEEVLAAERNKLERKNAADEENLKEIRNNYELKVLELHKNCEATDKKLQEVEENRVELLKNLEEKKNLITTQEQKIDLFQKQLRELMCQLTDVGLNFQRAKDEKAHLETEIEVKSSELSRLRQELHTMTIENSALTNDRVKLTSNLEKKERECMDLTADLVKCKQQFQETMKHNTDINQNLHRDSEQKNCEIEKLRMQIQILKRNSDQVLAEKIAECQDQNKQLELKFSHEIKIQTDKYEKSLAELDKISDMLEDMKKEDSFIKSALSNITIEKKELNDLLCKEKIVLEAKLLESEKLITQKTESEKELGEKISKLHMNLASTEKKYRGSYSGKDNKIMPLEKKLSNLDLSTVSQPSLTIQTQKNTAKNIKNIHIKNEEIITSGKIKSILKPLVTLNSLKSSPKPTPKKISFNFGSDSSDDVSDFDHHSTTSSYNDKFDELMKIESHPIQMQLSLSQSSNPETPTKSKKFFKSRGNI